MQTKTRKITFGTKEWADSNVNCYSGCSNDCRYCYAQKMAIRFKRKTEKTWKFMVPNHKSINKGYRKRSGRVMFPTSHDITPESLENCLIVLKKLVESRNYILITTKPNFYCTEEICREFNENKILIQFRFTITSVNNKLLKFWEPGAPNFEERLKSLKYAFNQGYKTSISIEPFLDEDPYELVGLLKPYTTESIWIGKMNYIRSRGILDSEKIFYERIKQVNSKRNLLKIVKKTEVYDPLLRIKDSIFNYLNGYFDK